MRKKYLFGIFILFVMITDLALARDGSGRFVFAIRKPHLHRDGFRAATGHRSKKAAARKSGGNSINTTSV